jgi:hypothetical protein
MKYKVLVDDNFHYQDEDERYEHGQFDSLQAAITACKKIVNEFLLSRYQAGMTAKELYDYYTSFGDDPFIVPAHEQIPFSAWDYAKERCAEICQRKNQS